MANGVFWVGQDGNIWMKDAGGTYNAGGNGAGNGNYVVQNGQLYDRWGDNGPVLMQGYGQIADPAVTPPAPGGGGGGGGGGTLNQGGVNNTQQTIDQIPGLLQAALAAEGVTYGNTVSGFNAAEAGQRDSYGKETVTNQQNYDANFMDSIRAGIKGLGGLMSMLRGTGAGGGTAEDIARDTVGGTTANDIRGGADVQKENQGVLDSALSTFLTETGTKRKQAEDTRVNNERAIRRDSSTQLQDLFGRMAGFYGDAGNAGAANEWMGRAGALTPEIAANSMRQVSAYDTAPVQVQAPKLTAFSGPTQPSVQTAPGGQVGSGIFTMNDTRRRKDAAPVPVGV